MEPAIKVYFWVRQLLELQGQGWCCVPPHGCLDSPVSTQPQLSSKPILRSRWDYELESMPWQGRSVLSPTACTACCLETQMRQEFCSAGRKSHRLFFLFRCHCKHGCWMSCAASCVLWYGSLEKQAESCMKQQVRL